MSSAELDRSGESPLRAMSIARFIPRFTQPRLLTTNIPTYRHSFSLPVQDEQPPDSTTQQLGEAAQSAAEPASPTTASYVEWNKLLPVPSNLLGSFQDLFQHGSHNAVRDPDQQAQHGQQNSIGNTPTSSASPPPRLVFFGEQHHQPQVMRAQLQTLHALHQQCQLASQHQARSSAGSASMPAPIYRLHLILEHFSVLDQHMLNSFSTGKLGPDELAEIYQAQSEEAFHIGHYMPLLMLAKELNVPIWGGFPPRSWARKVFRDGVESIKPDEQRRVNPILTDETSSSSTTTPSQPQAPSPQAAASAMSFRPPLFTAWSAVTQIGAAHRSYLSGLMRPDLPPRFPELPEHTHSGSDTQPDKNASGEATHRSPIYPTWLLKPHAIEAKGFGPAQTLKDSYLAHVTAWILQGAHSSAMSNEAATSQHREAASEGGTPSSAAVTAGAGEPERPIVNIALVVCGLGHCEYGFGCPERVVELLSQQDRSTSDDSTTLLPYIIASKPLDAGIWLGHEHSLQPTSAQDAPTSRQEEADGSGSVQRWLRDPWGRKMADAVLLYDWIDDEPDDETDGNADGHQPTSSA